MPDLMTNQSSKTYPDDGSVSASLFAQARKVLPGGNTRTTVFMAPYPIYAVRGAGCYIYDADGVERIDFINNYTSLIHGHAHPEIVRVAREQLEKGACFALPTESEITLASLLCDRIASAEKVRFTNSGSEALMMAIKAARAFTSRPKIAKVEGAYHGSYDFVEVSEDPTPDNWGEPVPANIPYCAGTPDSVLNEVIVIPFNDARKAEEILRPHARELAAIIVDPLPPRAGLIPASPEFLSTLRRIADEFEIVLISDEVISFRVDYNGAQKAFGFKADLTTLGKIIGGGFPVGAIVGRTDVMSVFDPTQGKPKTPHGGTFNANPMTMMAGLKAMELMTRDAYEQLNQLGDKARHDINGLFRKAGFPAQATGRGSLLRLHMTDAQLTDYRSAYPSTKARNALAQLHRFLLNHGILIGPSGLIALSTAMRQSHVDELCSAIRSGIQDISI